VGMFDIVMVPCPRCGEMIEVQSESGLRKLKTYSLVDCPDDVLKDVNRKAPFVCPVCGTTFKVVFKVVPATSEN